MSRLTTMMVAVPILTLLLALPGQASGADPSHEKDLEELRAVLKTVRDAVNSDNLDALIPVLHKEFSITMVDQALLTNMTELKDYFHKRFKAEGAFLTSVKIDPVTDGPTRFIDGKTGINRGASTDTYTLRNGKEVALKPRWTSTALRDEDGKWKIVSLHVGVNMLDNPILTTAEYLQYWWGGGGLILGFVIGYLVRPRRKAAAA